MSTTLIIIVTALYVGVAISEAHAGRTGLSIMFAGYAFANMGVLWTIWRQIV